MMRRACPIAAAVLVGAAALLAAPAAHADAPVCSAVLFTPTSGGAYVVEQPETASGVAYCSGEAEVTFGVESPPDHGMLSAVTPNGNGGATFSYTPTLGYTGADAVTLVATSADNPPVSMRFDIDVRPTTDDPPVCTATLFEPSNADGYLVEAGETAEGRLECSDDEGQELTFSSATAPTRGVLGPLVTDGPDAADFTYTSSGTVGADSFSFVADDGTSESLPAVVDVEVVPGGNDPPVCAVDGATTTDSSGAYEVEQGEAASMLVRCGDDEDDPLTFAVSKTPTRGLLAPLVARGADAVETTYTGGSTLGFDEFRVTADDGNNPPSTVIVRTRIVADRNDPPRCTVEVARAPVDGRYRVEQGRSLAGHLQCEDETDPLTFALGSPPRTDASAVIATDGGFTYTTSPTTATGTDAFQVTASDGEHVVPLTVPILVTAATNDAPVCEATLSTGADAQDVFLVERDRPVGGQIVCDDDEGDVLTFGLASPPAHGAVGAVTVQSRTRATFTYTPSSGYVGDDTFALSAADPSNPATVAVVDLRVAPPTPGAPRCTGRLHTPSDGGRYAVEVGELVTGTLTCFEPDGDPMTYRVATAASRGAVTTPTPSGGAARFTYQAGSDLGSDRFELAASDGSESSNLVAIDVDVVEETDSPPQCSAALFTELRSSGAYAAENRRANSGVVSCVDDEGGPLTFETSVAPAHGTIAGLVTEGTFASMTYSAADGYLGADTTSIRVRDGGGNEDVAELAFDVVASENTAPTCELTLSAPQAGGSTYELVAGASAPGSITCTDAEGDALTFASAPGPTRGALSPLTGSGGTREFTYTAPATAGADSFVLRAEDALGAARSVTVAVSVAAAAPPDTPGPAPSPDPPPGGGGGSGGDAGPPVTGQAPPAPAPPPNATPAPPAQTPPTPVALLSALKFGAGKKGEAVRLTFKAGAGESVVVTLRAKVGRRTMQVGKASKRFTKAGSVTFDVKLSKKALKELRRTRKLTVSVKVVSKSSTAKTRTVNKRLTLRRKR